MPATRESHPSPLRGSTFRRRCRPREPGSRLRIPRRKHCRPLSDHRSSFRARQHSRPSRRQESRPLPASSRNLSREPDGARHAGSGWNPINRRPWGQTKRISRSSDQCGHTERAFGRARSRMTASTMPPWLASPARVRPAEAPVRLRLNRTRTGLLAVGCRKDHALPFRE